MWFSPSSFPSRQKVYSPPVFPYQSECGLFLLVKPTGRRSWMMDYWFHGKKLRMRLGAYPDMLLAGAWGCAGEACAKIVQGRNLAAVATRINSKSLPRSFAHNMFVDSRSGSSGLFGPT